MANVNTKLIKNMKFENIKVGDAVLVNKEIKYDRYSVESFLIPVKVIRVTLTQFITDGDLRFKKTRWF